MKKILCTLYLALCTLNANAFVGFYQTIDDETNKPKSIVALYKYIETERDGDREEKLGGRIIALYGEDGKISETLSNPVKRAEKVDGKPFMSGLDIIWKMEYDDDDNEYEDGRIMDPKSGSVYRSVMWQDDKKTLKVRGKIGPFGRTQTWNVLKVSDLPKNLQNLDMSKWMPKVVE